MKNLNEVSEKVQISGDDRSARSFDIAVSNGRRMKALMTGARFEFKLSGDGFLIESAPWAKSRLHAFVGLGEHRMSDSGREIAKVVYSGLFGLNRFLVIGDKKFSFPRKRCFKLNRSTWSYKKGLLEISDIDPHDLIPIIASGVYWIIRQYSQENMS